MPVLRTAVLRWFSDETAGWPSDRRKELAFGLFAGEYAEDKLSAILILESIAGELDHSDLDALAHRFRRGEIADWSTTDWLGIKLLSRLVRRGWWMADPVLAWTENPDEPLWMRRAGLVAFVPLAAAGGDGPLGRPLVERLLRATESLIVSSERFAQTAAGWLLRDLSAAEPGVVVAFVDTHRGELSREARAMAMARIEGRTGSRRRRSSASSE